MMESRLTRLATTLMDATTDRDEAVQEQILEALCALGNAEPGHVLRACDGYLRQHDKLAYPHRVIILRAVESVVRHNLDTLDKGTAKVVISLASHEMTKSKDLVWEWQQAASSVLVAVGQRFINKVMEEALTKFQPGILPHYFVLQTFANLAVSNVFGMVPFLNSILGTMLPMLGMAKQDHMKSVFCYALQHFSESIQDYLANLDQAPDPTVRRDSFAGDIGCAFDVLLGSWSGHREPRVRLAVVAALGPMCHLLPGDKLEEQLPKLIPTLLGLYRKHPEPFPISKSLSQILEASINIGSRSLDGQLDGLLGTLHPQVCAPADPNVPLSSKNHTEVLRCFTILACSFPDRVLAFLLPKLESSAERTRVGTLMVLRHLINSAPAQMEIKKPFVLSFMKLPLQDSNHKVRRALVQVISAMAHHGYLEQPGGEALLEFLVRQCALPAEGPPRKGPPDPEELSSDSLRSISIDTLFLLSTTVDRMGPVLWPFLLGFLPLPAFTPALAPLCRSLLGLATRMERDTEGTLLRYDLHATLPSPHALTTRLLVVSCQPHAGQGRGALALRLLQVLSSSLEPSLDSLWGRSIPALLEHLEGHTEQSLPQQDWEEKLLQFLQDTLGVVSDTAWISPLVTELCQQLGSASCPREKNFLYKCIGTALGACASKELVLRQLQELLETAKFQEEAEREGLASCFGICARTHLEEALAKLEDFLRSDVFRRSGGLFGIFKERSEAELERMKSCLILCYGHVAAAAPPELLLPRLESDILRNIFQYFHTKVLGIKVEPKDVPLKLSLLRSLAMVGRAVSCGIGPSGFVLARKAELVAHLVEFIRAEPPEVLRTPIRQRAMLTCAHLVPLEPPLSDQDRAELVDTCLGSVLALPALEEEEQEEGDSPNSQVLLGDTLRALRVLLQSLLHRDLTPHGLQDMFDHLAPWVRSPRHQERERAVELSADLLEFYLRELNVSAVTPFYSLAALLALLCPRCSDRQRRVRLRALQGVLSLLCIHGCYQGFSREHRDEALEGLQALRAGLEEPDVTVLFHTCTSIAAVIGKRIPPDQLLSLLLSLFEGLVDPDRNCSRAAAVIANCLIRERGGILQEKVPELLSTIHAQLAQVSEDSIRRAAQQTVLILAGHHCGLVVGTLLGSALPFDSPSCAMWRALGTEPALTPRVLEQLLEKLNRDIPYKESKGFLLGGGSERVATALPLAATCALRELLAVPEAGPAILELFPLLFGTLLRRLSCSLGVQPPRAPTGRGTRSVQPGSCALETLQALLARGGTEAVAQDVGTAGGWDLLGSPERHHDGVTLLARAMARHAGPRLPLVLKNLLPALSSGFECQRVTVTAFCAELLGSPAVKELALLEPLLDTLTGLQRDSALPVRVLALRGLGNVAQGAPDKVRRHGSSLLASMMGGLDDKDDPQNVVALEAMAGLARLLELLEPRDVRPVLLHVAIRIRPFFDSETPELRRCSVALFGSLAHVGGTEGGEAFLEQVLHGLVPLLLHLQDPQPDVVRACKSALQMCGPCVGSEGLRGMLGGHLHPSGALHFGEFLNDVCKHLMQSYPEMLNRLISTNLFYFKSPWAEIRAAAPMFVGFLVLHVEEEQSQQVDLDQLLPALNLLLKDPVPAVRVKVAETLGRLVRLL